MSLQTDVQTDVSGSGSFVPCALIQPRRQRRDVAEDQFCGPCLLGHVIHC